MAVDIPNLEDAAHDAVAVPNSTDLRIYEAAIAGDGVLSGCEVTADSPASLDVDVASGTVRFGTSEVVVSAGEVTITTPHASNPRRDLVVVSDAGVKSIVAGTPKAIDPDDPSIVPVLPALPADRVALAAIYVPAGATTLTADELNDRRAFVESASVATPWTRVPKGTDETIQSDATLSNDAELKFAMLANTRYSVRGFIIGEGNAASDFKYAFTGPASPNRVSGYVRHGFEGANMGDTPSILNGYLGSTTISFGTASTDVIIVFEFFIDNGANAGDFAFQWAQAASVAENTKVLRGSYLERALA